MTNPSLRRHTDAEELSAIVLEQADRLFRGEVTKERLAAAEAGQWPSELWQSVEQAGLPLALVPETQGGSGLPSIDALRLIRQAGYHGVPAPLPETIFATALWTEACGTAIAGPASLAPVSAGDSLAIERSPHGFVLQGEARRVPWASQVDHLLVYAREPSGAGRLALLPRAATNFQLSRNLANEPRDTVFLPGIALPEEAVRPAPAACAEGFLLIGALMRAQQMVGAMERCLDYALAYAMQRQQFGRAIGKFQAIQHMLADAAGQFAAAAAAAEIAAEAYGTSEFGFAVAIGKARAGEAAGKVAEVCHQVHGAIGFTQEHPLHFASRRLWAWRDEFGHETYWQQRIGRSVCSAGGEALWPTLVGG